MGGTTFRQPTLRAGKLPGLADRRIKPRKGNEFPGRIESLNVANFAKDRSSKHRTDSGDRGDERIRLREQFRDLSIQLVQLFFDEVDLFDQLSDLEGKRLFRIRGFVLRCRFLRSTWRSPLDLG